MSFKKNISIFAATMFCVACCVNCHAMDKSFKLEYMDARCEGGSCSEKDNKNKSDNKKNPDEKAEKSEEDKKAANVLNDDEEN